MSRLLNEQFRLDRDDDQFPVVQFPVVQFQGLGTADQQVADTRAPDTAGFSTVAVDPDLRFFSAADSFSASALTFGTVQQLGDYLISNKGEGPHQWPSHTITVNINNLNSTDRAYAQNALDLWDDIANITIVYVSSGADITYYDPANTQAVTNYSYYISTGNIVNGATVTIGTLYNGAPRGETFLHETGHALGLGHLGPYDGVWTNQIWANDTVQWSVMSYGRQNTLGNTGSNIPVDSPAMADIYAIGTIYGFRANHTGDTVYGFNNNTGQSAFSFSVGVTHDFTIYDTGGTDTIDASGYSNTQTINLNAGTWSSVGGYINNIGIYLTSTIENAVGGSNSDAITGNGVANTIRGGLGNDTINGAGGTDTAVFSGNFSSYTLTDLGGGSVRVVGPDGTDTLSNVELLRFADQTVSWPPVAAAGSISISDVTITEGNSGIKVATFTVTRTGGTQAFSVNFSTANGTATTADGDYVATSGTLQFGANENAKTISVTINGDGRVEPNETFTVQLSNPTNSATIADGSGLGTIVNDDTNRAPVVTVPSANVAATANQAIAASSLFSASDPDGDALTYYLYNNSVSTSGGHWVVNGTVVPNDTMYAVTAAQLAQTTFVAGRAGSSDDVLVKVFDGTAYSNWAEFHVNVPAAANRAPVVTVPSANVTATANQAIAASSLFSASDPDGDTLTYYLYNNSVSTTGGHWVVNGTIVPNDTMYAVTAAQLAQTTFVAGRPGSSDDVLIKVYDGKVYTNWSEFHVNVPAPADDYRDSLSDLSAPFGQVAVNGTRTGNLETTGDHDWFAVQLTANTNYTINLQGASGGGGTLSDPYLRLYSSTGTLLNWNDDATPGNLNSQITFRPTASGTYYLDAAAYDDSSAGTYRIGLTAQVNQAPVITVPSANVSASPRQAIAAASLFSANDADGDTLTYYLYNNTVSTTGGHWVVNGTVVPNDTLYAVTAAQLAQTTFVPGGAGTSDDLLVKAFDGRVYSNWSEFHVNVPVSANHAPTVTVTAANVAANPGQTLAVSSLFSASDVDGDTLKYYLYDNSIGSSDGHFVINGVVMARDVIYTVTAAQLATTTYVAGTAGTSDHLLIKAGDGFTYSGWGELHVNVTGPNHAPNVIAPSGNVAANPGQVFQVSSLFSAADIDGDSLTYYIYDNTVATSGGHFVLNGQSLAADRVIGLTQAQFNQLTFVAGASGKADDLNIKVFDGHTATAWSNFDIVSSGSANHAPTAVAGPGTVTGVPGQIFQLSNLFQATDVDGNALTYYVYDNTIATSRGHFALNGVALPSDAVVPLTASQFQQATFVTGAHGGNDDIFIKVFDGTVMTNWSEFHVIV